MRILIIGQILSLMIVISVKSEHETCKADDTECNDDKDDVNEDNNVESLMVQAANKNGKLNQTQESEEDDTEEVDGEFEPCKKTEADGQLQRMLMTNAGYKLEKGVKLIKVHCQPKHDDFLSNGFYEARGYAPEDKAEAEPMLIFTMLPGQGLQPHSHDLDEDMTVGYGELEQFYWSNGPGIPLNRTVRAGSRVQVEASVTHAIFAGHTGVIFHQPVHNELTWRKTWFAPTS